MSRVILRLATVSIFTSIVTAQWPFQNWHWPQQQQFGLQPIVPQNIFQQFQSWTQSTTTTTAQTPIELVPNPDLEQGNWPTPDWRNWPVGPDWNDRRNSWDGEFGWGGKDQEKH